MKNITPAILTDMGICPTCYDKVHNHILYGDNTDKILFKNDNLECFLVGNPRSEGQYYVQCVMV